MRYGTGTGHLACAERLRRADLSAKAETLVQIRNVGRYGEIGENNRGLVSPLLVRSLTVSSTDYEPAILPTRQ